MERPERTIEDIRYAQLQSYCNRRSEVARVANDEQTHLVTHLEGVTPPEWQRPVAHVFISPIHL